MSGTPYTPTSAGPTSAGPQPPSGFGSTQPNQTLPSLNHKFDTSNNRGSGDFEDSRRSSLDSRVHQNMDKLTINPSSPYTSANASQSSLVSGLQRERGIQANGYRGPRYSAVGPLSPLGPRSRGTFTAGRVAPPILENPRADIYNADIPTAGQAYAFPDPEATPARPISTYSRRGSYAESISSSIFTTDSRLPPGQHGKYGDMCGLYAFSHFETELPTHHHSLQHKQIQDLIDDPDSPNSNTPYSRTPELRITHKLAERKRRSEMKDCFEMLRVRLPANQTNKSSKWETLQRGKPFQASKSICISNCADNVAAIDYITSLETKVTQSRSEISQLRNEVEKLHHRNAEQEVQMKEMNQQLQRVQQQQGQSSYDTPPSAVSHSPMFGGAQYSSAAEPPRTLPPIMNGAAMQGVQYSDERR